MFMKVANNSGGHCITTNTLLILIQDLNIYVYLLMYFFLLCFASFQHLQIFWEKKKKQPGKKSNKNQLDQDQEISHYHQKDIL